MSGAARNLTLERAAITPLFDDTTRAAAIVRLQAEIVRHESFTAAACAFVTALTSEAECERVSLGLWRERSTRLEAISSEPARPQESAETRELAGLMDEAIEQGITIAVPASSGASFISLAHATAARRSGIAICTVPLVVRDRAVGAVSFERGQAKPFTHAEAQTLENAVCLLGPVLYFLKKSDTPWLERTAASARNAVERLLSSHRARARRVALAAAGVLIALALVPVERQIAGRARIEGSVQRALVASSEGYIQAVHARPGDVVKAGQALAELADKDLLLEKRKAVSQLAQYENAYAGAVARADRAAAGINIAKGAEARASIELVDSKLSRAQIVAPFDGVVIKGDLSQSIGAPVQQGDPLMTVARIDSFRVIVEVDERDIRPVQVGQRVSVTLSASPWSALAAETTRITPMSTVVEGANIFEVEASLLEQSPDVRPGLRGVGKITAGRQPVAVALVRRATDWARLWLWTWFG